MKNLIKSQKLDEIPSLEIFLHKTHIYMKKIQIKLIIRALVG